jgi:uncharacterized protein
MLDFSRIEGFDWDAGNGRKSADKHGISQAECEQIFFDLQLMVLTDVRHSMHEERFHALGRTPGGGHLHVTFTLRAEGRLLRVISARPMSRKERSNYAREA